ncbi:MAG: acetaldehyde dehydrogenase (acetylating) [Alphaproteobacteria bacterium]
MSGKINCAIIGSGNIGADLMIKILKRSSILAVTAVAGIDPQSEGLAMAKARGIATTSKGIEGLTAMPEFAAIKFVFDATSAGAHQRHDAVCRAAGKIMIDLTPAAIGPYVIPVVNSDAHLDAMNVNMVTCGGQATIPMVFAVNRVAKVHYGEIIASVASKSAGPGTRANIDEFTETTRRAIEILGGAGRGKAIIILNPAEPPLIMRDTIFCLSADAEPDAISASVKAMVAEVQEYVPGYRLKQEVQFERFGANNPVRIPGYGEFSGVKSSIFLEVEGAGDYLPPYAGNLDIMTAAAVRTAERMAVHRFAGVLA